MTEVNRVTINTYEMPLDQLYEDVLAGALAEMSTESGVKNVVEVVPPEITILSTPPARRDEVFNIVEDFGRHLFSLSQRGNVRVRSERGRPVIQAEVGGATRAIEVEMDGSQRGVVRLILAS